MLTDKQKITLHDPIMTHQHHQQFIRKWVNNPHTPEHIQHILVELANKPKAECKKYYFVNDEIYCVEYTPQKWVKKQGVWQKCDSFSGRNYNMHK